MTDSLNHRIQKFDPSGRFLAQWGEPGNGPGQLSGPAGIAVDAAGRVYAADRGNDRVQVFDAVGRFLGARTALEEAGPAIVANTLLNALGFGVLAFSQVPANARLGLLVMAALVASCTLTLLGLGPVLHLVWKGEGR